MSAAPATRTPRIRMLRDLLSGGTWIHVREIATICGPEYSCYIAELRTQGHVIRERREYYGNQTLVWFRLEPSARNSAARSGLEHEVSVEE